MKHETRRKASNIGAIVGGVSTLLTGVQVRAQVGVIDIALNALIWFGIVYGVCSLIIKVKGEK
jgi:hypothetical protein